MAPTTTTPFTTPSTTPTTTATTTPNTTAVSLPHECQTAVNLTEWWRRDTNGSDIRGKAPQLEIERFRPEDIFDLYACDFRADLNWFRFSGEAGKDGATHTNM